MIWLSHVIFSCLFTLSFLSFFEIGRKEILFYLVFSSLFSVLPDVDTKSFSRRTIFGRIFYYIFFFPFLILRKEPKHRGVTHTLLFLSMLSILCFIFQLIFGMQLLFISLLMGYFSHIVLDSFSKRGVRPYLPLGKKCVSGPIRVGSISEYIFDFITVSFFFILEIFHIERYFFAVFLSYFFLRSII